VWMAGARRKIRSERAPVFRMDQLKN